MTMAQSTLRIGTRGSRLALVQTEMVARALGDTGTPCEIVAVKTSGDRVLDRPLAEAGGKGLFTKELEEALLADRIDLAVHSMKDVPVQLPPGLVIGAILEREDPADVLVSNVAPSLLALPAGARVGTSSVRRAAQLKRARPDLVPVLLRGNVDTRLGKLEDGDMAAIILALAGLKRLGLVGRVTDILSTDEWLPSLAQGAVGIEIRANDKRSAAAVMPLNHPATALALACERAFQAALDGSCKTPIAGLAVWDGAVLRFRGEVLAPDGSDFAATGFEKPCVDCGIDAAARAGQETGAMLRPRVAGWLTV
jgi:hydroxymethylbilane synthase